MKQLHSRVEPAGLTGQKRRTEQERIARRQKPLLPPKPPLNSGLETDIQEVESDNDEVNSSLFPSVSTFRGTTQTRDGPRRHFTVRKK